MKSCVIAYKKNSSGDLYLTNLTLDINGCPVKGRVDNGGWHFEWRDGEILAKCRDSADESCIVTRIPCTEFHVIEIPSKVRSAFKYADEHAEKAVLMRPVNTKLTYTADKKSKYEELW